MSVEPLDVVAQGSDLRLENVMLLSQTLSGEQVTAHIFGPEVFLDARSLETSCAGMRIQLITSISLMVEATVSSSLMTDMS
jgi:hypothetical protein